jgi:hypothetical protein
VITRPAVVIVYVASVVLAAVAYLGGFGLQEALHCTGNWKSWAEPCRLGSVDITMTMFSLQFYGMIFLFYGAIPIGGLLFLFDSFRKNGG